MSETLFAPAATWPIRWVCDISAASPTVTGEAASFGSMVMYALTGRQFGLTQVKLRPCRDFPLDTPFPDAWLSWPGTQRPPLYATTVTGGWWWFPAGCGSCGGGGCQCATLNLVKLPAPVHDIVEVRVDGVVVTGAPTSGYRLDNNRYVRRLLDSSGVSTWPLLNDLSLDDTQVGTWSITAHYGVDVPPGVAAAVGELACEYIRAVQGEDCRLPRNVTQLARQGVTITLPDMGSMLDQGRTGFELVDFAVQALNPSHLRARSRVYSIDKPDHVRAGS